MVVDGVNDRTHLRVRRVVGLVGQNLLGIVVTEDRSIVIVDNGVCWGILVGVNKVRSSLSLPFLADHSGAPRGSRGKKPLAPPAGGTLGSRTVIANPSRSRVSYPGGCEYARESQVKRTLVQVSPRYLSSLLAFSMLAWGATRQIVPSRPTPGGVWRDRIRQAQLRKLEGEKV